MKKIFKKYSILMLIVTILLSIFSMGCNASPYGKFEKISNMNVARGGQRLFLLKDGKVLVFGGDYYLKPYGRSGLQGDFSKSISAEIFDPKTNTFTLKKGLDRKIYNNYGATLLNDGRILVTGGSNGFGKSGIVYNTSEIYDPETDTVTQGPNMNSPRENHASVLLKDGRVLIFGGLIGKVDNWLNNTAEIYDPVQNKFTLLESSPKFRPSGQNNVHVLSNGMVYIIRICENFVKSGYYTDYNFELFDPQTNNFNVIKFENIKNKGQYSYNLYKSVLLKNDKIVLFEVGSGRGSGFNQVEVYDPKTNNIQTIGSMKAKDRSGFGVTLLKDGNILITGGNTGYTITLKDTNTAEIFDTKKMKFYNLDKMKTNYGLSEATLLNDGRVLITGGITRDWGTKMPKKAEVFIPTNKIEGE